MRFTTRQSFTLRFSILTSFITVILAFGISSLVSEACADDGHGKGEKEGGSVVFLEIESPTEPITFETLPAEVEVRFRWAENHVLFGWDGYQTTITVGPLNNPVVQEVFFYTPGVEIRPMGSSGTHFYTFTHTVEIPEGTEPGCYDLTVRVDEVFSNSPLNVCCWQIRTLEDVVCVEECQIDVPLYEQGATDWGSDMLLASNRTIGRRGCALVSMSMVLRHAGVNSLIIDGVVQDQNPGTLNTVLRNAGAYTGSATILWDPAARAAHPNLGFNTSSWNSSSLEDLDRIVCELGHPVVVRVPGNPDHFVVVTGKSDGKFQINDPGYTNRTNLEDAYNNNFSIRGYIVGTPNDRSGVTFAVAADQPETDLFVLDSMGNASGVDPETGEQIGEIPLSAHFRDAVEDNLTGGPAVEFGQQVPIFRPDEGLYRVEVRGSMPSVFEVVVRTYAYDGSFQGDVKLLGISGVGSLHRFDVLFVKDLNAEPIVRREVTLEGIADEVANAFLLGLIGNRGVANSSTEKLQAAEGALEREQPDVAIRVLDAFMSAVEAQSGKHIAPEVADILLDSAETVIDDLIHTFFGDND